MPLDAPASTPADGAAPAAGAPAVAPGEAGSAAAPAAPATPTGTDAAIADARARLKAAGAAPAAGAGEGAPAAGAADAATGTDGAGTVEGAEGAETEEGAEAAPAFEVTLDPLEERGEQPIILEAPDEETFNRLNRLGNEAKLGREVKGRQAELDQAQEELQQVEDMIAIDPVGFATKHLPGKHRPVMALQLLMEPTVLAAVEAHLTERAKRMGEGSAATLTEILDDPAALRLLQSELRADRAELTNELRRQTEERRTLKASAERIKEVVRGLIPPTVKGEQRDFLFRDAIRDIRERCDRLGIKTLESVEIQMLVKDRFKAYGVEPYLAGNGGSPAGGGAPANGAAPSRPPAKSAAELQAARATRRAAAAAAPAGAGAPAASPRPELPATTDERIQMARKVGLRKMLGRS